MPQSRYIFHKFYYLLTFALVSFTSLGQTKSIIDGDTIQNTESYIQLSRRDQITKQLLQRHFISLGYFEVKIEEEPSDKSIQYKIVRGTKYENVEIGYCNNSTNEAKYNIQEIPSEIETILQQLENNGYPFAEIFLDSVKIDSNHVIACIQIERNLFFEIDSLIVKGTDKIPLHYIQKTIQLKKGDVYSEKKYKNISGKIKNAALCSEIKPAEVIFKKDGKADLYLYLKPTKRNSFSGIIGIQPDDKGKIGITGDVNIKLNNAFKKAESIDFQWRKIRALTQDLNAKLNYPFLFKSNFGISAGLKLFKQDSSFIQVEQRLGIRYYFSPKQYIESFAKFDNSTSYITAINQRSTSNTILGISLNWENLDYYINPRKGIAVELSIGRGTRTITGEENEEDIQSSIIDGFGKIDYYIKLFKRSTLKISSQGATKTTPNVYFNDLFRIGGINTILGFDEQSIYASTYGIGTLEYRYLFDYNSHFHVFSQIAVYESTVANNYSNDIPYSFGAGVDFETNAGVFSFNYALGSQQGNPILLKTGKIHFGFVNYF